jgi:hypothetical protein
MKSWLLFADSYLVGLGIVVALVVYPAFRDVGPSEWQQYHVRHSRTISIAVGPVWLLQGVLCAAWLLQGPNRILGVIHGAFALAGVATTIFGAVPQHNVIARERTLSHLQKLQLWHWVRTLVWVVALVCSLIF